MTLIRTIELEYDLIEIHYNPILKTKPYLVRVYNWNSNEPEELRIDKEEFDNLYLTLKQHKFL
jgi:hypothetical protein